MKSKVAIILTVLFLMFAGTSAYGQGVEVGDGVSSSTKCTGDIYRDMAAAKACANLAEKQGTALGYDISCNASKIYFPFVDSTGRNFYITRTCTVNGRAGHGAALLAGFDPGNSGYVRINSGWNILQVELGGNTGQSGQTVAQNTGNTSTPPPTRSRSRNLSNQTGQSGGLPSSSPTSYVQRLNNILSNIISNLKKQIAVINNSTPTPPAPTANIPTFPTNIPPRTAGSVSGGVASGPLSTSGNNNSSYVACTTNLFCEDPATGDRYKPGPSGCGGQSFYDLNPTASKSVLDRTRTVARCTTPGNEKPECSAVRFQSRNCASALGKINDGSNNFDVSGLPTSPRAPGTLYSNNMSFFSVGPVGRVLCSYDDPKFALSCGAIMTGVVYCLPGYAPSGCVAP